MKKKTALTQIEEDDDVLRQSIMVCWCLVLRRTSSQTGFEGGESEIQILIGPNSTENSPQWFLFHYGHTGPHFRKMGVVSGGEGV